MLVVDTASDMGLETEDSEEKMSQSATALMVLLYGRATFTDVRDSVVRD